MKSLIGHAVFFGLAVAAASTLGCSSASPSGSPPSAGAGEEQTGTVKMDLEVAPGVTISVLRWTITNPLTGFSLSGAVNEQFDNVIDFQVASLPTGAGYQIELDATSTDGTLSCAGTASFTVVRGTTVPVNLTLLCTGVVADSGTVVVGATTQVCANINGITGALEATVNSAVPLSATASAGSVTPVFAWSATAGTFDNASSATPVFTCPAAPALVTITLNVTPSAAACATTTSESIVVHCDALNPTFTNVYGNVIGARCTSCHQPGKSGVLVGGLDMSTAAAAYANLVGQAALGTGAGTSGVTCASLGVNQTLDAGGDGGPVLLRVAPSDSADSLLLDKVSAKLAGTNPPCGSSMPLGATAAPLTAAQVSLIAAWIDNGAKND